MAEAAADTQGDAEPAKPALSGSSQAAILLMALGEEEAASILQHMEPSEVQALGEAMTAIKGVSQEQIGDTLDQFIDRIGHESSLSLGSADYFKSTLTRALGKDKATSVLSQMHTRDEEQGLTALKWMDPRVIVKLVRNEHPQIIATVLSQLSRAQAGEVLNQLPEKIQADIVLRITRLDSVHPAAMKELNEIITQLFQNNADIELTGIGGVQSAAEILNGVNKDTEKSILEIIESIDGELCEKIRDGMFIFENLLALDDRGMQSLLREVSNEHMLLALKGASIELQQKIFKNMSKRAAELLKDDLEAKGPVKLTEVEESQREILIVAKRLSDEGTIALSSKGDDYV